MTEALLGEDPLCLKCSSQLYYRVSLLILLPASGNSVNIERLCFNIILFTGSRHFRGKSEEGAWAGLKQDSAARCITQKHSHDRILMLKNFIRKPKEAKVAAEQSCLGATSTYISLWITSDYSTDHLLLKFRLLRVSIHFSVCLPLSQCASPPLTHAPLFLYSLADPIFPLHLKLHTHTHKHTQRWAESGCDNAGNQGEKGVFAW